MIVNYCLSRSGSNLIEYWGLWLYLWRKSI